MRRRDYILLTLASAPFSFSGCLGDDDEIQDDSTDPDDFDYEQRTFTGDDSLPIELEGSGPAIYREVPLGEGLTVFDVSHDGDDEFIVGYRRPDHSGSPAINVDGPFDGETIAQLDGGVSELIITTHGTWSVSIRHLPSSEPEPLPVEVSGDSYTVAGPFDFGGETSFRASFEDDTEFHAVVWDEERMVPDGYIGTAQQRTLDGVSFTHDGLGWLSVDAYGPWTVTFEET